MSNLEKPPMDVLQRKVRLEFEELRARLEEAEQTLEAIRSGEVDALVVYGEEGEKVYTLKGADEPYRVFVEQMKDGAVTLDGSGLMLYCNQRTAELFGEPLEKIIGTRFAEYVAPACREDLATLLSKADHGPSHLELNLNRSSVLTPVQVSIAPLGPDMSATFAVTITDLSHQKHHEEALRAANKELEGFCYTVSHDLRAPLRAMISSSRILMEDFADEVPEAAVEKLLKIESSASKLAQLIDDLLNFARLGRHRVGTKSVDLSGIAERVVSELGADAHHASIKIEPGIVAIGDDQLLYIVLLNLISNAVKFSKGCSSPTVIVGCEERNGASAYFVRDNGIGFDMAYVDRIFKPFERLHADEEYPGTGIGLANAERIVTRHEGRIWAESEPGAGTTFYFTVGE